MSSVTLSRDNDVSVISIDNPPVNVLSLAVRRGLLDCLEDAVRDAATDAIVICCEGRTFVAGADIREFDQPPAEPQLPKLVAAIEARRSELKKAELEEKLKSEAIDVTQPARGQATGGLAQGEVDAGTGLFAEIGAVFKFVVCNETSLCWKNQHRESDNGKDCRECLAAQVTH